MVRFGWPVKTTKHSTPPEERNTHTPPLYHGQDNASFVPFPSPSPTTHTATNTTQMAHFLSFPAWRRHQERQVKRAQCLSMLDIRTYQADFERHREQMVSSQREKSLPPTPTSSNEGASGAHTYPTYSPTEDQSSRRPSSRQALTSTTASPARSSPTHAKNALAQAALAIGLPHSMPQASASSLRPDVNSMALVTVPQANLHPVQPPGVRRTKSFHQLSRKFGREDGDSTHAGSQKPRTYRGTPLGVVGAFDSDEKEEGNALEGIPSHVTPPRIPLVRQASFWNRKRNDSSKLTATRPTPLSSEHARDSFDHLSPILPALPPMSPFLFDTNMSRSSQSSQTEEQLPTSPPGLDPRTDSRNRPLPPSPAASTPDLSVQTKEKLSLCKKRPSTADPTTDRSRTLTYYPRSHDHTSLLAPTPPQHPDIASPLQISRPRSQTNPPLFHRLSANILLFGSSSLSPPVPTTRTNRAITSYPPRASPRPSTSKLPPPKPLLNEESPIAYVYRLLDSINKADVASALASSGESFYANALQTYIDRFEFDGDPLDVALRKLLMDVGLPRETQQIDRVMQAFANRYLVCNPRLFTSDDHPYILAFSLLMLHTDAFNKSNKRKMTKVDYIRNTQRSGIFSEVLEYYYDNIVFAPFIFIEDPVDANLQRRPDSGPSRLLSGFPSQHYLLGNGSTVTLLGKNNKIDPYYLIAKNLLDPLRVDVQEYIPLENHYSFKDKSGVFNEEDIHETFIDARAIEVNDADRRMATSVFVLNTGGPATTTRPSVQQRSSPTYTPHQVSALRVVKVGLLHRKETSLDIGKRVKASKWRLWSVILTSSQLLFFRDDRWATSLQEQMKYSDRRVLVPPVPLLKPDEMLSLKDTVALFDRSSDKHDTFLFISNDRRPFLFQVPGDEEMSSWVSCINYASALKTTSVSMRAPGMSGKDIELVGVAAAASHLRDLQCASSDSRKCRVRSWCRNSDDDDFFDKLSSDPHAGCRSGRPKIINVREDIDISTTPSTIGVYQLKATFHQVKADLAAGRWSSFDVSTTRPNGRPRARSLETVAQARPTSLPEEELEHDRLSSRTRDIQSKIVELDSQISSLQQEEENGLRLLRNIAVLTPFQKGTRERLRMVVLQTSKGLQRSRLELVMRLCHKDVLSNDLIAQERERHRTKKIALKAATDTLQSRREPSISRVPPLRVEQPVIESSDDLPGSSQPLESSVAESFHSALDFNRPASATGRTTRLTNHLRKGQYAD
ncbi:hypothetical protein F5148DRAFT_645202 [Russula earlei]|uniref:Uncharacterized protein n=1 Tax=Russula earlei TaxID=71964 RepID=A0ACC0UM64_9AGAM|nr:hypothetical protein F5148DRAFT_645202 [Russula earlei]